MRRRPFRQTVVLAAAGVVLAAGSPAALAHGDDHGHGHDVQTVGVVGDGHSVQVDRTQVPAGAVRFDVSTVNPDAAVGSAVVLFRLADGVSLHQFFVDVAKEFDPATAAEGTRLASGDATFLGLADVKPGVPLTVTESLRPGDYYLMDLTAPPSADQDPPVAQLTVTGDGRHGDGVGRADVRIRLSGDRFLAPTVWPHRGTWSVRNIDDTVHFMLLQPVPQGTTDALVQQGLEAGTPPFLPSPPAVGSEVLSPGQRNTVDYDLAPGTYVLLCFVADETDGMPHALMGMHQVITLR